MKTNKGLLYHINLPHEEQWAKLTLSFAIILGGMLRIFPSLMASFPVLDGGMFYVAIEDILANGWRLPQTITYNQLNIPFTYPPFGFYVAAIIEKVSGLNRLDILRFLPAIYSLLAILAVYYLAQVIFEKKFMAALAAAFYALLPRSLWLIMGGSITRAPGVIFSILTLAFYYQVCFHGANQKKWFVMLFGSLVVLSHPEAAIHTAGICLWFLILAPNKRKNSIQSMQIAGGILLLTSPWWITLLARYGIEPIRAALGIGGGGITGTFLWPLINFAEEQFLPIITITALWGAIYKLYHKEFLLPGWLCIPFILSHRSAPGYAIIPLVLLAAVAIGEFLIPAIVASRNTTTEQENNLDGKINNITKGIVGIFIVYSFASAFWWSMLTKNNYVLSAENRTAMQWINESTPIRSHFLLLTGESNSGQDEVQEWFPALTGRISLTTIQGKEWQPGNLFTQAEEETKQLQLDCLTASVACIKDWVEKNRIEYEYIYVVDKSNNPYGLPIVNSLSSSNDYSLVYTSPEKEVLIYQSKNR